MKTISTLALLATFSLTGFTWIPDEPNTVNHVECHSTGPKSDFVIDIVRTGDNKFSANVFQSVPTLFRASYSNVSADWSGHFWNFEVEPNGLSPFHLLTRGEGSKDLDNVQASDPENNKFETPNETFSCSIL